MRGGKKLEDSHEDFPGRRKAVDTFTGLGGKSKADNSRPGTLSRVGEEHQPKSLFYSRFTDGQPPRLVPLETHKSWLTWNETRSGGGDRLSR